MFTVPPTQLLKCCVWENNLAAPIAHCGWARSCTSRENGRVTSQCLPSALQGPNAPAQELPRGLGPWMGSAMVKGQVKWLQILNLGTCNSH